MIKGIDISHYQGNVDIKSAKKDGVKFVICKATQGTGYVDPTYAENRKKVREAGLQFGSYHFANGSDPIKEADFFLKVVGDIQKEELLVLDWEIAHADPVKWCKSFLDRVQSKAGFKPILYTNEARVKSLNWKPVVDGDYGLWVAKYNSNNGEQGTKPVSGAWHAWAIWQFTSRGKVLGITGNVDVNTATDFLKKYGKPAVEVVKAVESVNDTKSIFYSQRKEDYKKIKLGTCTTTLYESSCAITTLCNFFKLHGQKLDGKGGYLNPEELNKICKEKGFYENGCMLRFDKVLAYFGCKYERIVDKSPGGIVVAETNFYRSVGVPQHFFVLDTQADYRIDPLDAVPTWEDNDYPIASYRKITLPEPKPEPKKEKETPKSPETPKNAPVSDSTPETKVDTPKEVENDVKVTIPSNQGVSGVDTLFHWLFSMFDKLFKK